MLSGHKKCERPAWADVVMLDGGSSAMIYACKLVSCVQLCLTKFI